jgi:hypothetical protein
MGIYYNYCLAKFINLIGGIMERIKPLFFDPLRDYLNLKSV